MRVYSSNLLKNVLIQPHEDELYNLNVITGYCSPSFISELINQISFNELKITIGMAGKEGIPVWEHIAYQKIDNDNEHIAINYYYGKPAIHAKIYSWKHDHNIEKDRSFTGSANMTKNGFKRLQETLAEVPPAEIENMFSLTDYISCNNAKVSNYIEITSSDKDSQKVNIAELKDTFRSINYVDLKLTSEKNGLVPEKSGLNWGQRSGRDPNQAYIPVPKKKHLANKDFFPQKGEHFTLITDDGESMLCVMAQDNAKAIESSSDNSILGRYFRERLNLYPGSFVTVNDLIDYGRDYVRIHKVNDDTFFMDFESAE
ncbi:restriction endonuclease PLD domain-containing protein [Salisediminibacterium halotolerans]|uniref:NgoFVII restriction endonuclease n=1 Tax=Salisediminibacterium halotolerans TaxID=517425 RepID=A0A1H9RCC9_9BACI|nr:restriction endonuclease PLD domain-containing protein [Salisediminibacterium haloalkalitolerans]SER70581.1 NgoFVII restriction endonuclease [Salisediminibacterium haloalkalitolerans]